MQLDKLNDFDNFQINIFDSNNYLSYTSPTILDCTKSNNPWV